MTNPALRSVPGVSFARRCAAGIEPNRKRIPEHLQSALMRAIGLNPHIGYEKAVEISPLAYREEMNLRDAALQLRLVSELRKGN